MATQAKKPIKILVCGPVNGEIEQIFARAVAVNKQAGPFDALFCVGPFFGKDETKLTTFFENTKEAPLPTYVLDQKPEKALLGSSTICPNLHVLDTSGVRMIANLRVAFSTHTNSNTVENILTMAGGGIDLLLTDTWPVGVDQRGAPAPAHTQQDSEAVARLASVLCPRYHITPTSGNFYERAPYRNPKNLHNPGGITRFMALSPCFNPDKQKYLVALNLSSSSDAEPANTTDSPYAPLAKKLKTAEPVPQMPPKENTKQFNRWGLDTEDLPHKASSGHAHHEDPRGGRGGGGNRGRHANKNFVQNKNPQQCWFCLSSPDVETHLVASIGNDVYLALAKGGLVDDHVLIVPIEHHPAIASLPQGTLDEINRYKLAMKQYYTQTNRVMVIFERNLPTKGTLHGHLQIVGIPKAAAEKAITLLNSEASAQGFQFSEFPSAQPLRDIVGPSPYFTIEVATSKFIYVYMPSETSRPVPLQFGREWMAKLLGCPERVEWKKCAVPKKEEEKMVENFKKQFADFDPAE
eukprot:Phypoly_transcript_06504.p1 GENE.Phypoly_transcript_06504~~Phypoly_transcript_06504.p1  ORF type:complete len:522 (+),score=76.22 Phypoly_transcript_06504:58-1623(+)